MGKIRITIFLALGASLLGAAEAALDSGAPRPEAEASATVTVTAEALPVALDQTPNPVQVIDQDTIQRRGATNLTELLQDRLPGQVFNAGGVGTAATIFLGGARAQDTVVTLDGLRLTDVSGLGGVNASAIDLAGIDRVEIQQGPCSTRFGSDALGGAVALYSAASAPAGFSGEARGTAGNEGILGGRLGAAYGWDQGWVRLGVSAQREDQVLDPYNPYRSVGTFLGLGHQLGEDNLLTVNYFNSFSGVPIPIVYVDYGTGTRSSYQYDPAREDFNRTQILSGTLRSQLTPVLSSELTLGQVLENRLEPDVNTNLPTTPYRSRRNQAVGHITWQSTAAGSVSAGLDLSADDARTPDLSGENTLTATGRHMALYLEGQREVVARVRLVASLRTERDRVTVPTFSAGTSDSASNQTTGKLGLNVTLPEGFRFFASAGTGFSNPLLYQSLFNANYGGEALANEKSRTAQTGLTWASGPWTAGVTLSRTLFEDLVYYDADGGVPIPAWGGYLSGIYRNGQQVRAQSAEFKAGYETKVWGVDGFYRNQETRDLQAPAGQQLSSAAAIARSPFQTLGAHAFRVLGAFRLEGRWSWVGPRYDSTLASPEDPSQSFKEHFNDLSLSAAWSARDNLTFTLRGEHLMQPRTSLDQWLNRVRDFENDASLVFGYPAQPPAVTLEARYRF